MAERYLRLARKTVQKGSFALPVLVLLSVYVTVLYWRAFAVGVLSDGWVLLEIGSQGFLEAPFVLLSYHTIPVTNVFMAVLWNLFGLTESWYQLTNLAELVLVGWLVYLLGCTLFRQARVGLLASLLLLANSSFYEVPFWPTVGNFQSLAALFYLLGIFVLHRAFHSPRSWPWIFLFSLCGLAAFFTYEPAISLLGVGFLYAYLVPVRDTEPLSWPDRRRRVLAVLVPSLPAIAVVLGSKLYTSSQGYQALFLPSDWENLKFRAHLLVRGCIAIFSLVAADHKLYKILTFGLAPPPGTPAQVGLFMLWCLLLVAGAVFLLWKSRSGTVRFLTLWFAMHIVTVAAATGIVSRHFYLAALPASLLMAWLLWRGAEKLAAWIDRWNALGGGRAPETRTADLSRTAAVLVLVVLTLLAVNAKTDLDTAGTLYKEATRASRQVAALVQQRLAEAPASPPKVVLVNMPAILTKDGLGVFAFVNGLHQLLQLSTGRRITNPELYYTYAAFADGKFANASQPIPLSELARRVQDPASLVLMFDDQTRTVTEANAVTWRPPEAYDLDSAPFLEWESGAWPWFRVYAHRPLEMPLTAPESSWVAIRYLRSPGVVFSVKNGSGSPLEIRAPAAVSPSWPIVTLPFIEAAEPADADIILSAETEVWLAGVWPFVPPERYDPQNAPFLPWRSRPFPHFVVEGPIRLPVRASGCTEHPCSVHIEYLAEKGRDFWLAVEGVSDRSFAFDDLTAPEWRSERIPIGTSHSAVVRVQPRGSAPLFIRQVASE